MEEHEMQRNNSTNSRKSRVKSTGVVSGKRYNSLGVSDGHGQQASPHTYNSVGKEGSVTKASILEA